MAKIGGFIDVDDEMWDSVGTAPTSSDSKNSSILGDIGTDLNVGAASAMRGITALGDLTNPARLWNDNYKPAVAEWAAADADTWGSDAWMAKKKREYSAARQQAEANYEADTKEDNGFLQNTATAIGSLVRNPRALVGRVVQSAPASIGAGVAGARAGVQIASMGAQKSLLAAAEAKAAHAGAAAAEGLMSAGSATDAIVQDNIANGRDLMRGTGYAAAVGAGVGLTALGASRIGGGVEASIANKSVREMEAEAAAKAAQKLEGRGLVRRAIGSRPVKNFLGEGVEEAAQAPWETGFQNLATDKPFMEGMGQAVGEGFVTGGAMGGGAGMLNYARSSRNTPNVGNQGTPEEANRQALIDQANAEAQAQADAQAAPQGLAQLPSDEMAEAEKQNAEKDAREAKVKELVPTATSWLEPHYTADYKKAVANKGSQEAKKVAALSERLATLASEDENTGTLFDAVMRAQKAGSAASQKALRKPMEDGVKEVEDIIRTAQQNGQDIPTTIAGNAKLYAEEGKSAQAAFYEDVLANYTGQDKAEGYVGAQQRYYADIAAQKEAAKAAKKASKVSTPKAATPKAEAVEPAAPAQEDDLLSQVAPWASAPAKNLQSARAKYKRLSDEQKAALGRLAEAHKLTGGGAPLKAMAVIDRLSTPQGRDGITTQYRKEERTAVAAFRKATTQEEMDKALNEAARANATLEMAANPEFTPTEESINAYKKRLTDEKAQAESEKQRVAEEAKQIAAAKKEMNPNGYLGEKKIGDGPAKWYVNATEEEKKAYQTAREAAETVGYSPSVTTIVNSVKEYRSAKDPAAHAKDIYEGRSKGVGSEARRDFWAVFDDAVRSNNFVVDKERAEKAKKAAQNARSVLKNAYTAAAFEKAKEAGTVGRKVTPKTVKNAIKKRAREQKIVEAYDKATGATPTAETAKAEKPTTNAPKILHPMQTGDKTSTVDVAAKSDAALAKAKYVQRAAGMNGKFGESANAAVDAKLNEFITKSPGKYFDAKPEGASGNAVSAWRAAQVNRIANNTTAAGGKFPAAYVKTFDEFFSTLFKESHKDKTGEGKAKKPAKADKPTPKAEAKAEPKAEAKEEPKAEQTKEPSEDAKTKAKEFLKTTDMDAMKEVLAVLIRFSGVFGTPGTGKDAATAWLSNAMAKYYDLAGKQDKTGDEKKAYDELTLAVGLAKEENPAGEDALSKAINRVAANKPTDDGGDPVEEVGVDGGIRDGQGGTTAYSSLEDDALAATVALAGAEFVDEAYGKLAPTDEDADWGGVFKSVIDAVVKDGRAEDFAVAVAEALKAMLKARVNTEYSNNSGINLALGKVASEVHDALKAATGKEFPVLDSAAKQAEATDYAAETRNPATKMAMPKSLLEGRDDHAGYKQVDEEALANEPYEPKSVSMAEMVAQFSVQFIKTRLFTGRGLSAQMAKDIAENNSLYERFFSSEFVQAVTNAYNALKQAGLHMPMSAFIADGLRMPTPNVGQEFYQSQGYEFTANADEIERMTNPLLGERVGKKPAKMRVAVVMPIPADKFMSEEEAKADAMMKEAGIPVLHEVAHAKDDATSEGISNILAARRDDEAFEAQVQELRRLSRLSSRLLGKNDVAGLREVARGYLGEDATDTDIDDAVKGLYLLSGRFSTALNSPAEVQNKELVAELGSLMTNPAATKMIEAVAPSVAKLGRSIVNVVYAENRKTKAVGLRANGQGVSGRNKGALHFRNGPSNSDVGEGTRGDAQGTGGSSGQGRGGKEAGITAEQQAKAERDAADYLADRKAKDLKGRAKEFFTNAKDILFKSALGFAQLSDLLDYALGKGILTKSITAYRTASERFNAYTKKHATKISEIVDYANKLSDKERQQCNAFIADAVINEVWPYNESAVFPSRSAYVNYLARMLKSNKRDTLRNLADAWTKFSPAQKEAVHRVFAQGVSDHKERNRIMRAKLEERLTKTALAEKDRDARVKLIAKGLQDLEGFGKQNGGLPMPYVQLRREGNYVVSARSAEYRAKEEAIKKLSQSMDTLDPDEQKETKGNIEKLKRELDTLAKTGDGYFVAFASTMGEAEAIREKLMATGKYAESSAYERAKFLASHVPSWQKLEEILGVVEHAEDDVNLTEGKPRRAAAIEELREIAYNMYLRTLAQESAKKQLMSRRGVKGFEQDMFDNFRDSGYTTGKWLAGMEHGAKVSQALRDMNDEFAEMRPGEGDNNKLAMASAVRNEILKRYELTQQDDSKAVNNVLRLAAFHTLITNPSYYLQNALQSHMMSAPYMAGKHGLARVETTLTKNLLSVAKVLRTDPFMRDLSSLKKAGIVTEQESNMLKVERDRGMIDIGMTSDFGKEGSGLPVLGKTPVVGDVLNWAAETGVKLSRQIEIANRVATLLTAYRLEKSKGANHEAAMRYAHEVVQVTHGDYSNYNAPRFFKMNGYTKVLSQFRKFSIIQLCFLGRMLKEATKNGSPEQKAIARWQLAHTIGTYAAVTGLRGTPIVATLLYLAAASMGDPGDDEEDLIRKAVGDKQLADFLLGGVPRVLGVDLTDKVGAPSMFSPLPYSNFNPLDPTKTASQNFGDLAADLSGPLGSVVKKSLTAAQYFTRGQFDRAVESMMPSGVSNALQAVRFANEGISNTRGDILMKPDDMSTADVFLKALGLTSSAMSDRNKLVDTTYRHDAAFNREAADLKNAYRNARDSSDSAKMAALRKEWIAMNRRWVQKGYKAKKITEMTADARRSMRVTNRAVGGAQTTESNRRFVRNMANLYTEK